MRPPQPTITTCHAPAFTGLIRSIKHYHFTSTAPLKLHPEGHIELIFQQADFYHNTSATHGWQLRPGSFVGGLHEQSYHIRPASANAQLLSIQFYAGTARHFLPHRLNAFKNRIVDVADALGRTYAHHTHAVYDAPNASAQLQWVQQLLEQLYSPQPTSPVEQALSQIKHSKGTAKVQQLASQSGLSVAQFRKRFGEEVGMSPKSYSKVVRIGHVLESLRHQPRQKLVELAYQSGYFDQAHFTRDFQSVTGFSPREHLRSA